MSLVWLPSEFFGNKEGRILSFICVRC